MQKNKISITPDTSLMEKIGATSFTLPEAIVELIANSIDARIREKNGYKKLDVEIEISPNQDEIKIKDNGMGMSEDVLINALTLASSSDHLLGKRKRKGTFGLGLKTASASIGGKWSILTRSNDSKLDYFVEIDLQKFSLSQEWVAEIISLPQSEKSELGSEKSGTIITINKLRDRKPDVGPVTKRVGDYFLPHIKAKEITININGVETIPDERKFINDTKTEFDESIIDEDQNTTYRIYGWWALDVKTNNNGEYGFNLYKENQLIERWDKSWIKNHLMSSRVIGEAHLDYMPVNFNKQGFQTNTTEWRITREHMTEFLRPAVKSSNLANTGKNDSNKIAKVIQGIKQAYGGLPPLNNSAVIEEINSKDGSIPSKQQEKFKVIDPRTILIKDHVKISIDHQIINMSDTEITPWTYIDEELNINDEDAKRYIKVTVYVNSNSLIYNKCKDRDLSLIGLFAMADCLTFFLVKSNFLNLEESIKIRDQWLATSIEE